MKGFLKNVLSSAIGVILAIIMLIGSILILVLISTLLSSIFSKGGKIAPNTVIKMKFDYVISDKPTTDPFENFTPFGNFEPNNNRHLYKVLKSIELAGDNENIKGMVLELNSFQNPGAATIKEIRDALKEFKEKGKFIYSYSTTFGKTSYYLASVSDSIFMYPTGGMELSGLSSTTPFFTETMQKVGIKPEIIRHGKFKAAVEPFMLTEMSDENREQTELLLSDIWKTMLKDISESRKISIDSLNTLADDLIISMLPHKPIETGLIDQLIYPDQFHKFISEKINLKSEDELEFISIYDLQSPKNKSKNKIAIIYAEGGIDGDNKNIHSGYTKTVKKVLDNDDIDAVVFRVNSPGGSALISDEILSQMKLSKKEKPIVVSMGNVAASGGYYIACAADKILASENTITGSIGVFGLFFTAEKLLTEKMKLHFSNVKTNKFSDLGSLERSLSEEEKSLIQISVENTYNTFIQHVSDARSMSTDEVDEIGQGRVWTGLSARKNNLIDSMGGLKDAIQVASELAELTDFKIVEFPKSKNSIEVILDDITEAKLLERRSAEEIYLENIGKKFLHMQGIQALLPIEYKLD